MKTPFLDQVYEQVDFDRDLVFKFFTIFSLYEHALKKAGFLKADRWDNAQPDWEAFARKIETSFNPDETQELQAAVRYMLGRPVKRQVSKVGQLEFLPRERPERESDIVWLSILVRGVRNNLFHGAKFRYDRPRDTKLIESCLIILEAWAQVHPEVENALKYAH
jgi:hypothetical protein